MTQIKLVQRPVLPVSRGLQMLLCLVCVLMILPVPVLAVVDAEPNPTIQAIPDNTWYEVENSKMQQVEAGKAFFSNILDRGSAFLDSRGMFPFSGGAFDSKRNRLIIWGGGHAAYFGNEIYTFDLTDFSWQRITDPSPHVVPTTSPCPSLSVDGRPSSRHTYYNLDYIPTIDRFFSTPGGALSCFAGGVDPDTWTFDFDNTQWNNLKPDNERDQQPPVWAPTAAAYNPLDNKVYSVGPAGLFAYDVVANRWKKLNGVPVSLDRGVVVDTKRGLLVVIGTSVAAVPQDKGVIVYDIGNQNYTPQYWDTMDGKSIVEVWRPGISKAVYRPGVNYDPVADRIVVWDGGAVRALNMDTHRWHELAAPSQDAQLKGTYGRFRYSPRENAYVLVNGSRENALIYKLANKSSVVSIAGQPVSRSVDHGQNVTFSVLAVGSGTLGYQWRKNGDAIDAATSASYSFTVLDVADDDAVFDVVVSNGTTSEISAGATLKIIQDVTAPELLSVFATSDTHIAIVFSEPVDTDSAQDVANYQVDPGIAVISANLSGDARTVSLTVSQLTADTAYTVLVSNVRDLVPNPNIIAAQSSQGFTYRTADDFEDSNADGWIPLVSTRWSVVMDEGDEAYYLNTTNLSPDGERLGEYSLLPANFGDFTFTAQARLGDEVGTNALADYVVVFGFQDKDNYYFAMFNNDQKSTQLFKLVEGRREALTAAADIDWLTDNAYHSIAIIRTGSFISVSFDNNLIMSANDSTFGAGKVGIGSFNDSAYFDDVSVTGVTSEMPDNITPVITLKGENPQTITVGIAYPELGATAFDSLDGNISDKIEIDISAVDTAIAGSYSVTYNVSDTAGNAASEVTRLVNVITVTAANDDVAPVITLIGNNTQTITIGADYIESGATAQDNVDGDISANIMIDTSAVDTTTAGSYRVTYNVSDAAENAASEASRTVNVVAASSSAGGPGGGSGALGWWTLAFVVAFSFVKVLNNRGYHRRHSVLRLLHRRQPGK